MLSSCTIEQDSLSIVQGGPNGLQSQLKSRHILQDLGALLTVHHGSQQIALTYQPLIVLHQDLECGCLLSIALSHTIIFGDRLLLNGSFQSADSSG